MSNNEDNSDFIDHIRNNIRKSYEEEQQGKMSGDIEFIVMVTGCSKYEAELALENNGLDALEAARQMKTN